MLRTSMKDCDEYSDNVRELTENFLMLTAPSVSGWNLVRCPLHRTVMQFGVVGGPKIVHGISRPDITGFLFQDTQFQDCAVLDGHPTLGSDLVIVPPAQPFSILTKCPHQWISLSVPSKLIDELAGGDARYSNLRSSCKTAVTLPPAAMTRLAEAAFTARCELTSAPAADPQAIESSLLDLLADILSVRTAERQFDDSEMDCTDLLMTSVLEFVRARPSDKILIDDIAAVAGVNERTLLRTFRHYFDMGPKQYLKLRQLNLVRRMLRQRRTDRITATIIMSNYGVTEFGRFAVEYKGLFGESPSDTRRAGNDLDYRAEIDFQSAVGEQSLRQDAV